MADRPIPNPVLVVNVWLKTLPAVTAVTGARISYRLGGTYPAIRLADIGPRDRGPEENLARVQVECWADDYDTARAIAADVEAAVPAFRGLFGGGHVAGAAVASGPFSSPDTKTERHRHMLDVEFWLYPAPPV